MDFLDRVDDQQYSRELSVAPNYSDFEQLVVMGDLSKLSAPQRVQYYNAVCKSVGLNPMTRPFDYIVLNGKLTLYARKDATDQLRKINGVSIDDVNISESETEYIVMVKGHDKTGRNDIEIGVVSKKDMRGDTANAKMKALTKGKRRLTLSLCGLGWLDETEIETIPDAKLVQVKDDGAIVAGWQAPKLNAPILDDEPSTSSMTYETAAQETDSRGKLYVEYTTEELVDRSGWIAQAIGNAKTEKKREELQLKQAAIGAILQFRANHPEA